ncbi:Uncharacterised protein [Mycobacteroides abscessus subsp. abscessus]|nr:Uncharacterised protein [Mycobacteroides abscessus subsp. abscessus]
MHPIGLSLGKGQSSCGHAEAHGQYQFTAIHFRHPETIMVVPRRWAQPRPFWLLVARQHSGEQPVPQPDGVKQHGADMGNYAGEQPIRHPRVRLAQ